MELIPHTRTIRKTAVGFMIAGSSRPNNSWHKQTWFGISVQIYTCSVMRLIAYSPSCSTRWRGEGR